MHFLPKGLEFEVIWVTGMGAISPSQDSQGRQGKEAKSTALAKHVQEQP